jgi:hypothetical protein
MLHELAGHLRIDKGKAHIVDAKRIAHAHCVAELTKHAISPKIFVERPEKEGVEHTAFIDKSDNSKNAKCYNRAQDMPAQGFQVIDERHFYVFVLVCVRIIPARHSGLKTFVVLDSYMFARQKIPANEKIRTDSALSFRAAKLCFFPEPFIQAYQ